jgi:hypothetical protein
MSIVAVHGPHTFGSKALVQTGPAQAVADPVDGMKWTFSVSPPSSRPAGDFDWTYTPAGGAPASPINDTKGPHTITFTGPGVKTVTLTVSGTQGIPANGTYVMGINAQAGAGPK